MAVSIVNQNVERRSRGLIWDKCWLLSYGLMQDTRRSVTDSLDTGYDMNPAYPGHEDAVLPTRSRPPIVASPTRVLWRTNGARVTAGQLHLLRRNYSLWPCFSIIQWQFLNASCSGALVKPTAKLPSKFPALYVRRWKEQAIPVRTHKI
jgi:hypothetical protein